ncbi:uncharacterized protein TrAFT101_006505 [Trichoderma asperellum]|uniref:uncharacterized protein n=1 Tax=Trichoderma asperellum TaxID=101201 RepID=UPI00331CD632|nr:hypothetical protein TrAFT101_006505 [Trichoderma asperellum]
MSFYMQSLFPKNQSFSFEALRAAGYANAAGADIGEVMAICSRIAPGDEDAWLKEWKGSGDRAVANAEISLSKGNRSGARDAFLRAANYYRTAEFYRRDNPFNDALSASLATQSTRAFYAAMKLVDHITERVRIPYEGSVTLPGTIFRQREDQNKPRPLVIVNGGFDSTREEVGYGIAPWALEAGFNVLTFDGPGQGETLREQKLRFRPDWENVITPVVEYALSQEYVDEKKLVIMGISMGGFLVARAAAFEHRAAAIVVNDGIFDFGDSFRRSTPAIIKCLLKYGWYGTVNRLLGFVMPMDTGLSWALRNGKWVFGVTSGVEVLEAVNKYTLDGLVDKIVTPILVMDAADDHFLKGQPAALFGKLECEKAYVVLTQEEGASAHCHVGASARANQVVFDWLLPQLGMVSNASM